MKDKKKQIQEIAQIICGRSKDDICIIDNTSCDSSCCWARNAEAIYNVGYRKHPKDSIVLSREEYERLKRVENEKDRLYEIKLDLENQLIEKGWTDYEGADEIEKRVSKETAEKILQPLYNACKEDTYGQVVVDFAILENLAKKFGVEIKE
jgi:hypothetical protein